MDDELTDHEADEIFEHTQHIGNMIHVLAEAELTLATADIHLDEPPQPPD